MLTILIYLSTLILVTVLNAEVEAMVQDFFWRDYIHGDIPCDAIEAATDRYIGQVYNNGNMVATIYPHSDTAIIEMNGKKVIRNNVKIFCSNQPQNLYWEKVNFDKPYDNQMKYAVKGGYQENEFSLFIGKALHQGEWKIGKVVDITQSPKGLWLWDALGKTASLREFYLLKPGFLEAVVQDFFWRDYVHGDIPCDAIEASTGSHQPQNLYWEKVNFDKPYDCRMKDAVKGGSQENDFTLFIDKALDHNQPDNLYWEKVNFDKPYDGQMKDAVKGGYQENDFTLFIGKALHQGEWEIGKVIDITQIPKGIWLWDAEGKASNLREFYFLKYNTSSKPDFLEAVVQDFFWRDYVHGDIPCDAIEASTGRYIGQAYHNGNMVATIYPHSDAAIIEMWGKKSIRNNVKIFCSNQPQNLYWEKVNFNKPYDGQMKDAVKGGYLEKQFDLFIGKALHEGEWKIGKVADITQTSKGLWLWDAEGKATSLREFYLLKYNTSISGCMNRVF
ncbi:hypothetical protein Trydic_g1635 [Trypoxylus dichotomus]